MSLYSKIALRKPKRNNIPWLSHELKFTSNMGELIPVYWEEILPGDIMSVAVQSMTRFAPLIAPVMQRINSRYYAFFVPNRLLYGRDTWEQFITGGEDGTIDSKLPNFGNSALYTQFPSASDSRLRLLDYLGYASKKNWTNAVSLSTRIPHGLIAGPVLAYYQIWNQFFRDQNLQDEVDFEVNDRTTYLDIPGIMHKCWEKDYFTSSLPWLQRGPQTVLPIDFSSSDVQTTLSQRPNQGGLEFVDSETGAAIDPNQAYFNPNGQGQSPLSYLEGTSYKTASPANLTDFLTAETTLKEIEASFSINDFRRAAKLQEWLEKNARGGARYIEQIYSHWGVKSKDARLQRPEFLGACSIPVNISEVLQTSSTSSTSPQGNMAGHAISAAGTRLFRKRFFEEHGILMILQCTIPRSGYYGGTDRRLWKPDRFAFYWPEFSRIGEQPVYKGELCGIGSSGSIANFEADVFGYQERYSEYKTRNSRVCGDFATSLDFWHLDRSFNDVALNGDFVECNPRTDIFAVQESGADNLWNYAYFNVKASRLVDKRPIYGI